ncbi:MAG: hypothetical protein ABIH72_02695 [archaeon]
MPRLGGILGSILRGSVSVAALAFAFYAGAKAHYFVDRAEYVIFLSKLRHEEFSHPGNLSFRDEENSRGKLEKKVYNDMTNQPQYTIGTDFLPANNNFIYDGLRGRIQTASGTEIEYFFAESKEIANYAKERLPKGVDPEKIVYNRSSMPIQRQEEDGSALPYVLLLAAGGVAAGVYKRKEIAARTKLFAKETVRKWKMKSV